MYLARLTKKDYEQSSNLVISKFSNWDRLWSNTSSQSFHPYQCLQESSPVENIFCLNQCLFNDFFAQICVLADAFHSPCTTISARSESSLDIKNEITIAIIIIFTTMIIIIVKIMLIINNSTSSSPSAYQKVEKKQIDKGQKTSRKKSSPVNRLITFDPKLFGIMTQIVKIVFTTGITYHCKIWIKFSDKIKEKSKWSYISS